VTLVVLWTSLATVIGTYLGFPLVTLLRATVRPRGYASAEGDRSLMIVIAVHNEETAIGPKLDSVLACRYFAPLDIVVAADGCTDGTAAVVSAYASRGVRLIQLPRVGKAAALTAAVDTGSAEILVFSDANGALAIDALEAIVRPFADREVGGVAGNQRYEPSGDDDGLARGERSYWSYDRVLKRAESRAGNVISATGALYAIRRDLFQPVAEGVTDDFYLSTGVVAAGRRLVFAEDAVVYEPAASSGGVEYGRKVRIMTRGLQGVVLRKELLNPRRFGYYAIQLWCHKVLRRLMVFPLAALFVSSVMAGRQRRAYRVTAASQVALYAAGAAGLALGRTDHGCPRLLAAPAYFCLANAAAVQAVVNVARGHRIDRWEPARDQTGA
jgi:cellulose synthase/poly-beta-1,6-N-acetylglucosamine synthase-like glycosyltransferase